MPCYDPRPEHDHQSAIRAACEMAKKIRQIDSETGTAEFIYFPTLSEETRKWIADHEKFDKDCSR